MSETSEPTTLRPVPEWVEPGRFLELFVQAHRGPNGWESLSPDEAALLAVAQDLLLAARRVLSDFAAFNQHQHRLLVEGQSLASASQNWDEATTLYPVIDFQPLLDAVARAEGRTFPS